jgi:hypothetical protein
VNLGEQEVATCTNLVDTCIPPTALKHLQSKGLFKTKKEDTWKHSCTAYKRKFIEMDQTFDMDMMYP